MIKYILGVIARCFFVRVNIYIYERERHRQRKIATTTLTVSSTNTGDLAAISGKSTAAKGPYKLLG